MAFYHFLVLGEEKRQYYLAQMLKKEGHEVMEAMSLIAPIRYEIKKNKVYITPRKLNFNIKL